ncbi:MAG: hypothetical protein JWO36_3628 [Myxococcales bacterium]|nr:hypothetical protein [Myxococcales bacterium]
MRSSRNALVIAIALAGCGTDYASTNADGGAASADAASCASSYLTYESFGQPFVTNWCRGCHSVNLPDDMRQMAPNNINFDTLADVHTWSQRIAIRATLNPATMPPKGGPPDSDRALLAVWIGCGAP